MRRSIQARTKVNRDCFVDVSYYDLLKNPVDEIHKIYTKAGIFLDTSAKQAMVMTQQKNKQHRYGKHVYDIADFGLTKESIEEKYRFYREHYQIPVE